MKRIDGVAAEILDAYRQVVGTEYVPTLTEYLEVRKQAGEELRYGDVIAVGAADRTDGLTATRNVTNERSVPTESAGSAAADQHNGDGYALLRSLKDPWN